jgi:RNA polymerase sigma-70 factor (ECF subfamily)
LSAPYELSSGAARNDFEAELAPLWKRAQAGDEAAYREALEAIAARLRGYFARRLRSAPQDVEDLLQETLLALHLRRGTHDSALPVSNWVYAIARHKLVDVWRRRGRREALHQPLDDTAGLHALVHEELPARRDLEALLGALPEAQRLAIALIKIEGLSLAEASQRSGVSVSALKVRVHRGLRRLAGLVRKTR